MNIIFIDDNRLHISSDFASYLTRLSNGSRMGYERGRDGDDILGYNQKSIIKQWVMDGDVVCFYVLDEKKEEAGK